MSSWRAVYTTALVACGITITLSFTAIRVWDLRLGSSGLLLALFIAAMAYLAAIAVARHVGRPAFPALVALSLLTIAMRVPLITSTPGGGSDAFRYLWDARVQRAGLNPYTAIPNDPALAWLHTSETLRMNNMGVPSPYGPVAQFFFRAVTAAADSTRGIKVALTAVDLSVVLVLYYWLRRRGQNPLLAVAYAWNPLVPFETAFNAHIDVMGALAVVGVAFALTAGRRTTAAVLLALGVGTKLLPAVVAPLLWRRVRLRDAVVAAAVLAALYLPFLSDGGIPAGSLDDVVRRFRFNGPVFVWLESRVGPWAASVAALGAGLLTASAFAASRLRDDPAAWAWPMAVALLCAPLVYPWYLIAFLPFVTTRPALPLAVWSVSVLSTYRVWELFRHGGPWKVPSWILIVEYGPLAAAVVCVLWWRRVDKRP